MEEKKKRNRKIWLLIPAFLILLGAGAAGALWYFNEITLTVHLQGPREVELEYGEAYEEPGFYVTERGSILFREDRPSQVPVTVEGEIPPDQLGEFQLTYRAQGKKAEASAVRQVTVRDTEPPEIRLEGLDQEIRLEPGQIFEEPGYSAIDNVDGDLTDQVMVIEKQGELMYSVTDSSGNEATVTRAVPGYDPIPPTIHLEGESEYSLPLGIAYEEPGYSAFDDYTGDMTQFVEVEGEVNCRVPGVYPIVYRLLDSYGNAAEVVRNVTVEAVPRETVVLPQKKTIYLTFDDGPGPYTDYLLDVLARYGVKATFFVVGDHYPNVMRRIVREGHSIAVHSVTHNYSQIYASQEAYFQDILGEQAIIRDITGVETTLMRFPGGGSNLVSSFNEGIMSILTEAVQDAGFQYFDWNVDSNDAGGATTAKQVYENVIAGVQGKRAAVVLQHDIHPFSVEAVENIIRWGQANGYQFLPLEKNSYGAHHGVNN